MPSGEALVLAPELLNEDHDPPELVDREGELDEIVGALRSGTPRNGHVWLHGPLGCGRTALARHAAARVEALAAHVDCRAERTAYLIVDRIVGALRLVGSDMRRETNARLQVLRSGLRGRRLVVVLDDADALPPRELHDALVALTSIESASLLCVARDTRALLGELDQPHPCRFLPRIVALDALAAPALEAAILRRAEAALARDACPRSVALAIARQVAGDARLAVQVLRRAVNRAEVAGRRVLRVDDVAATVAELREMRRATILGRLTEHHRALLAAIVQAPGSSAAQVRAAYEAAMRAKGKEPAAERTLRKYLNRDLPSLGLVAIERAGARPIVTRYRALDGGTAGAGEPQR